MRGLDLVAADVSRLKLPVFDSELGLSSVAPTVYLAKEDLSSIAPMEYLAKEDLSSVAVLLRRVDDGRVRCSALIVIFGVT